VLRKAVEAYVIGNWDELARSGLLASEGARLLRELVCSTPLPGIPDTGETIAGFLLAFRKERLNLSVFARSSGAGLRTITTSLDELTQIRRRRLH
jgi:hypothetical protein